MLNEGSCARRVTQTLWNKEVDDANCLAFSSTFLNIFHPLTRTARPVLADSSAASASQQCAPPVVEAGRRRDAVLDGIDERVDLARVSASWYRSMKKGGAAGRGQRSRRSV